MMIKGDTILNSEPWAVQVPLAFQPEIHVGFSDDLAGWEGENPNF